MSQNKMNQCSQNLDEVVQILLNSQEQQEEFKTFDKKGTQCSEKKQSLNNFNSQDQKNESNEKDKLIDVLWTKEKYISFLENNSWDIYRLKQWEVWEHLDVQTINEFTQMCEYEINFKKAQEWLKADQSRQIDNILKEDEFKGLANFKKFKSWLRNQKYYRKSKMNNQSSIKTSAAQSTITSLRSCPISQIQNGKIAIFQEPLPSLSIQESSKFNNSITAQKLQEWNNIILQCELVTYSERNQILQKHYFYDPIAFVDLLKEYKQEKFFQNIFSNLLSIVLQLEDSHEKTNLFISACSFYNHEILSFDIKQVLYNDNIKSSILKLQRECNSQEAFGFLKLLFTNAFDLSEDFQNEITKIFQENYAAWKYLSNICKVLHTLYEKKLSITFLNVVIFLNYL